jgi:hypothetical protein
MLSVRLGQISEAKKIIDSLHTKQLIYGPFAVSRQRPELCCYFWPAGVKSWSGC